MRPYDLSNFADVGGMVKRTPIMMMKMQGYRVLHVCFGILQSGRLSVYHAPSSYPSCYVCLKYLICLRKIMRKCMVASHPASQPIWTALNGVHSIDPHYPGCEFPSP